MDPIDEEAVILLVKEIINSMYDVIMPAALVPSNAFFFQVRILIIDVWGQVMRIGRLTTAATGT